MSPRYSRLHPGARPWLHRRVAGTTGDAESSERRSPLLRNRDFTILWAGGAVSALGTSMSTLVLPLLAYAITGSTAQAGLAGAAVVLGEVLLRLPAGALVDRYARSRVLLVANLVGAVLYAALAVATLTGTLTLAGLVVVGVVSGGVDAFISPASSAAIRAVVPAAQLPAAYGNLLARERAAGLVGPPTGGALYSLARGVPFVVDAISYLAAAVSLRWLRHPLLPPDGERTTIRRGMAEGLRFVWGHVGVRVLMIWGGLFNLAVGYLFTSVTLRLVRAGVHPAAIGLVETIASVAGLAGALVVPLVVNRVRTGRFTVATTLVMAAVVAPMAWTTDVVVIGALQAAAIFLIPANNAGISAYLASVVPDRLQGRVNSAAGFVSNGLSPLAPVLAGVLLAVLGGRVATVIGAALIAATVLPLLASATVRDLGRPDTWAQKV